MLWQALYSSALPLSSCLCRALGWLEVRDEQPLRQVFSCALTQPCSCVILQILRNMSAFQSSLWTFPSVFPFQVLVILFLPQPGNVARSSCGLKPLLLIVFTNELWTVVFTERSSKASLRMELLRVLSGQIALFLWNRTLEQVQTCSAAALDNHCS